MYADVALERRALKDLIKKKLVTVKRRDAAGYLKEEHLKSERWACDAVRLSRTVFRYKPRDKADRAIVEALSDLGRDNPELGFGKFFGLLRADGHRWNHKLSMQ